MTNLSDPDSRTMNTDTDMFQGQSDGVKILQAGKYKFTCTMMYAMTDINNNTEGRWGAPGDHNQSIRIASRFVKDSMVNDHSDKHPAYVSGGSTLGFQQANPGPICVLSLIHI